MISVIVPIFNVEKYIVKCLESIVKQDYQNFELVLVNDGSTDNTVNVINNYLKDKDIIWKLINKENGGQASARNLGIARSKGEYISFIDSDDVISPDFLSSLLKAIKESNSEFSFCNYAFVKSQEYPKDENDEVLLFNKHDLLNTFLKRTINFVVPSMLFTRDFILKNRLMYNEQLRFSEDQSFIWNVILHCEKAIYLYKKMYGYYVRENSIMTGSPYNKIVNSYNEYKKYIPIIFEGYNSQFEKLVIARWELGTLYASAKLLNYKQYKDVYKRMSGSTIYKRIKGINEWRAYLLAFVCSLSPWIMYRSCKLVNLNG